MPPISFATEIRPLFRDKDVASMKETGHFDLSNYEDVRAHAAAIQERLTAGDMPCDGPWPKTNVDKFSKWIEDGMRP